MRSKPRGPSNHSQMSPATERRCADRPSRIATSESVLRKEVAGLQYGPNSQSTQNQAQQLGIKPGESGHAAGQRSSRPETVGAIDDLTRLAEFLERQGTPAAPKHAAAILKLAGVRWGPGKGD